MSEPGIIDIQFNMASIEAMLKSVRSVADLLSIEASDAVLIVRMLNGETLSGTVSDGLAEWYWLRKDYPAYGHSIRFEISPTSAYSDLIAAMQQSRDVDVISGEFGWPVLVSREARA